MSLFKKLIYRNTDILNKATPVDIEERLVIRSDDKTFGITGVDFTNQGESRTLLPTEGRLLWNEEDHSLEYGTINDSTIQIGQEYVYNVKNQTGSTIPKGTLVMANGTLGNSGRILVIPAIANGTYPSEYVMGLATHNILDGEDGLVTAFGKIRGIDTTGVPFSETWADGDILYANPTINGGFTKVLPSAPNNKIMVAIVIKADENNGTLFVRPTFGSKLGQSETNVQISATPTNNQVLAYNSSTQIWENKNPSSLDNFVLSTNIRNMLRLTQAEYNTLVDTSQLDNDTFYIIADDDV
jgi:hypothetical protein